MRIFGLTCNGLTNPIGLKSSGAQWRLSWRIESEQRGARQTAYRLMIATTTDLLDSGTPDLWDSGKIASDQSVNVNYAGTALEPRQRAHWRVTIWDGSGSPTDSDNAFFETGIGNDDWTGEFIGSPFAGGPQTSSPCPYVRKVFQVTKSVRRARLYATALGVYETSINGNRVGEDRLAPGWTDYAKRVQYQAYDVTDHITSGANVWGAILGDGWYCGHIGWRERQWYGDRPKFTGQLELIYEDGTQDIIPTDATWQVGYGPLLESDMLMGEIYDARREINGWDSDALHFDTSAWLPVTVFPRPEIELSAMQGPTIRDTQELTPVKPPQIIRGWPGHTYIFDLGQNMVGRIRFKVRGKDGETIRFRYAETLVGGPKAETGPIYTDNLRSAKQTDYYTCKGDPDGEIFETKFTFHGFRYVEVYGATSEPEMSDLTGIVMHSETPQTGNFECSDPLINQLQKNIDWGQRGNYLEIPTDCPQRDERLGWTGDAQVFVRTAAFNREVDTFFHKWMQDMRDAVGPQGEFPPFAPNINLVHSDGGAAWADAGVICPWTIYLCYGDTAILEENYDAMKRFVDFQAATAKDDIRCYHGYTGWMGFGDWLALDGSGQTEGGTPKDLLATAFFAYSSDLLSRAANALGKTDDAAFYRAQFERVRGVFQNRFITPGGLVFPGTQTAMVLALYFDLLPQNLRAAAARALADDVERRGVKLTTGFVGTSYLPHVLTEAGHLELAYRLLHQTSWPSWLYAVTQGATTIWERWDGWTHDKGFQDKGMNSFNHYAYGAIGEWLYRTVAGIDIDQASPGYKHIILRPRPLPASRNGLDHAQAYHDSPYGRIESSWNYSENGTWNWEVTVPPNTTATAYIPLPEGAVLSEGSDQEGAIALPDTDGEPVYSLLPGKYHFAVNP